MLNQTLDSTLAQVLEYKDILSYLNLSDLTEPEVATLQYIRLILDDTGNGTGETTICKYKCTCNAQRIYIELARHCTEFIISDQTAANKMKWLNGVKLEEGS